MMAPLQSANLGAVHANGRLNNNNNSDRSSSNANGNNKKKSIQKYLTNCKSLYSCIYCRTHLANHDELVSRSFQGNHGRAYLFNSVVNILCGPAVQRELNTGSHAVADIFCSNCQTNLGWKYEKAYVDSQKYKEGKFIIELTHVVRENRHLEFDKGELLFSQQRNNNRTTSTSSSSCSSSSFGRDNHLGTSSSPLSSGGQSSWSSSNNSPSFNDRYRKYEEVEEDVDDEDLMFPFYDDLCSSASSHPGNLSISRYNKMRRSLYLESKPYDWKYNADSSKDSGKGSSTKSPEDSKIHQASSSLASSLGDSPASSSNPSPSTSSGLSSPEQRLESDTLLRNAKSNNNRSTGSDNESNKPNDDVEQDDQQLNANFDETQFEFEDDKVIKMQLTEQHCDRLNASISADSNSSSSNLQQSDKVKIDLEEASGSSSSGEKINNSTCLVGGAARHETQLGRVNQVSSSSSSSSSTAIKSNAEASQKEFTVNISNGSSMSLDDEEFYDCYTDHEVVPAASMVLALDQQFKKL